MAINMADISDMDDQTDETVHPRDIPADNTYKSHKTLVPPAMATPMPRNVRATSNENRPEDVNQIVTVTATVLILAMGLSMAIVTGSFVMPTIITAISMGIWLSVVFYFQKKPIATSSRKPDGYLYDAKQKAETANAAKTRILAIASHEMRTPLNGILGMANLLDETQLSPEQQNYNDAIKTSGDALFAFVEDMLDITRIETGHFNLTPSPTNIQDELENICELLAPRAHEKNLELASITENGVPDTISLDSRRLRQILVNLLGNALKFTVTGGISLRAKIAKGNGSSDYIRFEIADTGPGIKDKDKGRVFEEFEQIDLDITRKFGGAGLGLAISKAIVEKMNGFISVHDNVPGGTIFTVDIPLPMTGGDKFRAIESNTEDTLAPVISVITGDMEAPIIDEMISQSGRNSKLVKTLDELDNLVAGDEKATIIIEEALIAGDFKLADNFTKFGKMIVLLEPSSRNKFEKYQELGFSSYLIRPVRRKSLEMILNQSPDIRPQSNINKTMKKHRFIKASYAERNNILLVEDNEINALLAVKVLEKSGHQVTLVENGKLACEAFRKAVEQDAPFTLVYMDLHMPVMDGLTAICAIREIEKELELDSTRIVALSADEQPQTREEVSLAGASGFLSKPLAPEQLSQDATISL